MALILKSDIFSECRSDKIWIPLEAIEVRMRDEMGAITMIFSPSNSSYCLIMLIDFFFQKSMIRNVYRNQFELAHTNRPMIIFSFNRFEGKFWNDSFCTKRHRFPNDIHRKLLIGNLRYKVGPH